MLFFFHANRYRFSKRTFRWLSNEYGVPEGCLKKFLEQLSDSDYVTILDEEERRREHAIARGDPIRFYQNVEKDTFKITTEVQDKVNNWFKNGDEK